MNDLILSQSMPNAKEVLLFSYRGIIINKKSLQNIMRQYRDKIKNNNSFLRSYSILISEYSDLPSNINQIRNFFIDKETGFLDIISQIKEIVSDNFFKDYPGFYDYNKIIDETTTVCFSTIIEDIKDNPKFKKFIVEEFKIGDKYFLTNDAKEFMMLKDRHFLEMKIYKIRTEQLYSAMMQFKTPEAFSQFIKILKKINSVKSKKNYNEAMSDYINHLFNITNGKTAEEVLLKK